MFKDGIRDIQFLFNLAVAYLENGQGEKAKRILDPLNFFFPRELDVDFLMAEAYRQMNLLPEAERGYRLVLAEDPDYLSAYMGLAHALDQEGKTEERDRVLADAALSAEKIRIKKGDRLLFESAF